MDKTKLKITPIRILSDGCKVMQGRVIEDGAIKEAGNAVSMHEGEWVEIIPVMTLREMLSLQRLQKSIAANESKDFTALCVELSKRVVAWNWTDNASDPLPEPYGKPEVIEGLYVDEIVWLIQQMGEPTGTRKNG